MRGTLDQLVTNSFRQHGLTDVLDVLGQVRGQYFLVGGTVRDSLLGQRANDLDIAVPNGDRLAQTLFANISSGSVNRHGNWRFELSSGQHVDLIQPQNFYKPFHTVAAMLQFFDTSVNAIGVDLGDSGNVVDPLDGINDLRRMRLTLPYARWTTLDDFESVHLALRTLRLLGRHPLSIVDCSLLRAQIPKFERVEWRDLYRLNHIGRSEAREQLLSICNRRQVA